jgi:endonuclease III
LKNKKKADCSFDHKMASKTPINKQSKYFYCESSRCEQTYGQTEEDLDAAFAGQSVTNVISGDKKFTGETWGSCLENAKIDFERFKTSAKRYADYDEHENALEQILKNFDVIFERKRDVIDRERTKRERRSGRCRNSVEETLNGSTAERRAEEEEEEEEERKARKRLAKEILKESLEEVRRLHVNASCRVQTRKPRVKVARDRLTAFRRRLREAFKVCDFEEYEKGVEDEKEKKRKRMDKDVFQRFHDQPARDIEEIRECCELFVKNGRSPHHLCEHLCYYREYEPARQLFVLRIACCERFGTAKSLDRWTSHLAINNNSNNNNNGNSNSGRLASPTTKLSSYAKSNENSVLGSGYKSFPWKVVFKNPLGETFETADDVLGCISALHENTNPSSISLGGNNPQGISFPRSSHGGSGVRLPGVKEHGLEQDVEILRAALWKESEDSIHCSSPVRVRREAAENDGYARSPLQLAPPGEGFIEAAGDVVTLRIDSFSDDDCENSEGEEQMYEDDDEKEVYRDGFDGFFSDSEEEEEEKEKIVKARKDVVVVKVKTETKEVEEEHQQAAAAATASTKEAGKEEEKKERKIPAHIALLNEQKMKHSFHSKVLLALENEPPINSKFTAFVKGEEQGEEENFPSCKEEKKCSRTNTKRTTSMMTMTQNRQIWSRPRHFDVPPRSPFGLLEEILWRDDWKVLTACMMLNCTTRLQVDRVLWELFTLAPTAEDAVKLGESEKGIALIENCLATIGLHRKRARAFVRLSQDVVNARKVVKVDDDIDNDLNRPHFVRDVSEFHGVGAYAADAHAMFCDGIIAAPPRDHALRWYHAFALERESENLSKNVLFVKETATTTTTTTAASL